MTVPESLGKILFILGLLIALSGLVLIYAPKIPFFGKLPGDIVIKKKDFTFYFPLATSIILSILLTIFLWLTGRK